MLNVSSNASDPSIGVSLTGSGTSSSGTLGVTPGSMSFGSVTIGSVQAQNGSVTASGGSVTLSSTSSSNSAFTLSGLTLPMTLAAGQSVPFTVTFAPTTTGTASANIAFFTTNSTSASETASGSGATIPHTVSLSWNPSTSTSVSGYNVYRGTSSAGPFSKINAALNPSMSYSDGTVQSGKTYYYATTAVDSSGAESAYSNLVTAAIPFP
ncbi:MAG TPA: choice-of-anchor D domain-containing protein [Candidatus Sulfotelmatobacter sp.]|nr:choice-of-anchor D domain-containing protein [Candidatus Sulfotelmatobacter sp.]